MDENNVLIKVRDGDSLSVPIELLTADSTVFSYLINDLGLKELELEDFAPDTVALFLTLLEAKVVDEIQKPLFRELHKLSMAFKVDWLTERCQAVLTEEINNADNYKRYDDVLFLFEESRYILSKWKIKLFTDLLISKRFTFYALYTTAFISQYMEDYEYTNLEPQQLDLLLKLAGCSTEIFLETILHNLADKEVLDRNTKHLLKSMNLALCIEQHPDLYHEMFEKLSALPELTNTDQGFILTLSTQSSKEAYCRKIKPRNTSMVSVEEYKDLDKCCETLHDILRLVEEERIRNVFLLLEALVRVIALNPPSTDEAEVFVKSLEITCKDHPLKRAPHQYIDMMLSALMLTELEQKFQGTALLEMIRDSETLSTQHDYVYIIGTADYISSNSILKMAQHYITKILQYTDIGCEATLRDLKLPFEFHHPGIPYCEISTEQDRCGLILKVCDVQGAYFGLELCTEKKDYENDGSGLHLHDAVCGDDIFWYGISEWTTHDGTRVNVPLLPGRGRAQDGQWKKKWFPNTTDLGTEKVVLFYHVKNYLAAR